MGNTSSNLGDEVITPSNRNAIVQLQSGGGRGGGYGTYFTHMAPSEIRFTQDSIGSKFQDGHSLDETFSDILYGRVTFQRGQLPPLVVMKHNGKWFALRGNRRLYLLKKLEAIGALEKVKVKVKPHNMDELMSQFTTRNDGVSVRVRGDPFIESRINNIIGEWRNRRQYDRRQYDGGAQDPGCVIL